MRKAVEDVRAFHEAGGVPVRETPMLPDKGEQLLRIALLREELMEYLAAVADQDLTGIADALADMAYIIVGTAHSYGLPLADVWDEVHRSNMDKFRDGVKLREDGKILKPEGWEPPRIKEIVDGAMGNLRLAEEASGTEPEADSGGDEATEEGR